MNRNLISAVEKALQLTKFDDYKNGHEIPDQILINELFNPKSDYGPCFRESEVKLSDYEHMSKKLMMLSGALAGYVHSQQ